MNARTLAGVILLIAAAPVSAAVEFKSAPRVEKDGEQLAITFELRESSDVEVSVLDAKGKVVRHLAAGMLGGKNAPPAPLKAGLQQRVTWDGKEDTGKPAAGGPFQVRVRAGMRVELGRFIGGSPYTGNVVSMPYRAPVNGLVCDREGNLFVLMMSAIGSHGNSGMWPWQLRKFDSKGAYVRTLLPYPPSTERARASGFQLLDLPDRAFAPANQTSLYPVFSVLGNEILSRPADGQVVFVHSEQRRLNFLTLDGTNKLRTVPLWPEAAKLNCPTWIDIQVALSPDGKYAYLSNVAGVAYDGKKPGDIAAAWPQGRIYRKDLSKPEGAPETFFDLELPDFDKQPYWMPSAWDKKTAAAGIDTDGQGNVFVCDLVNQQVVEIGPDGKRRSTTRVPSPDKVIVARKTGDLYVISRGVSRGALPAAKLFKISGRGDKAKVAAELALTGTVGGGYTLDEQSDMPILWLAGERKQGERDSGVLLRIEDRGDKFVVAGDNFLNRDKNAITFVGYMDVDREADLVYVTRSGGTVWRYRGETGAGGPLEIQAVDLTVGFDGHVYTWGTSGSYEGPIARYTRDLKPAPLKATGKHTFGHVYGRAGRGSSVCGMHVDRDGRVYATYGTNECHVRVYDGDGNLVDFPRKQRVTERDGKEVPVAIANVVGYGGSIRVDRAGNIYLLQAGMPRDYPVPAGFEKDEAYRHALGTIYRFSPKGGEVKTKGAEVTGVVGATATYPGCGPVSRWRAVGACACTKPRFDVDDFGRLYLPNGITFSVSIRDNADNEIVRFGAYGNYDCQGRDSKEPSPPIPLGWPVTASASDRYVYVGDCLNHRVVRVDKTFALEAKVDVPR
jgi:hypothetical protein